MLKQFWKVATCVVVMAALVVGCPQKTLTIFNSETKAIPGVVCGAVLQNLTGGQTIDVGDLTIANDATNLYVDYSTTGNWVITDVHMHVDSSGVDGDLIDDVPRSGGGAPIPGQMEYVDGDTNAPIPASPNPAIVSAVTEYTFTIPYAQEALGPCGNSLLIYAHAAVSLLDDGGNVIQGQTAFGGDTPGGTGKRWYFVAQYTTFCCPPPFDPPDDGSFRTQTQGGWGTECHGMNPGCYRDDHFAEAFPDGVTVGCSSGFMNTFTSSQAVQDYLPSGGAPRALTADHIDPLSTEAGVLGGQTLALALSLGFDAVDPDFGSSDNWLGDQLVCNTGTAADGISLAALLDEANALLGGCSGSLGLNTGAINNVLNLINQNYVDGDTDNGYVCAE
ncbi:MAG: hypothetical protein AAB353_11010 [Candidatus Hydrogenedentota bacterium]